MKTIKVNKISTNYKRIDDKKYNLIIALANNEKVLINRCNLTKPEAYRKSLEIINSINCKKIKDSTDNLTYFYRYNMDFENNTEKQAFINNFLFDSDNFIHALNLNNINEVDIENLINKINEKKKEAKITKNYDLDINEIICIDGISKYYNLSNKELIINMMIELYSMKKELFNSKTKVKK